MKEEDLDKRLAVQATKKGWADNKAKYAARILRHLRTELHNKPIIPYMDMVIKYLEEYEFDD